jgi:RNase P subunit RPR2
MMEIKERIRLIAVINFTFSALQHRPMIKCSSRYAVHGPPRILQKFCADCHKIFVTESMYSSRVEWGGRQLSDFV